MFTNKNVLVRSIALIVMILMIAAVALTACGDKAAQDAASNAQKDVDALKTEVTDLKTKLEAIQIPSLDEINGAVDALETAKESLEDKIDELEAALDAANADVEALETELANLKAAVDNLETTVAYLELEAWNEATEQVAEKLEVLEAEMAAFVNGGECEEHGVEYEGIGYYSDYQIDELEADYINAMFAIIRATSVENLNDIIDGFCTALDEIPNVFEEIKAYTEAIMADGAATYPEDQAYVKAGEVIYLEILADNTLATKALEYKVTNPSDPTDTTYNVLDWFYDVAIEYAKDWVKDFGVDLKAQMDYVIGKPATLGLYDSETYADTIATGNSYDYDWVTVDEQHTKWKDMITLLSSEGVNYADSVKAITDFDKTIEAFDSTELADRFAQLVDAKAAADVLNAEFAALVAQGGALNYGTMQANVTAATRTAINNAWDKIENWCETYEIPAQDPNFVAENYDLIDHEVIQNAEDLFEDLIVELREAFDDFVKKVEAIDVNESVAGTQIDPDSAAAIAEAWAAYNACARFGQIDDLDGILDNEGDKTIGNYYNVLAKANADYDAVVKLIADVKAEVKKIATFDLTEFFTTIESNATGVKAAYVAYYDAKIATLSTSITAIEGWLEDLEGYYQDVEDDAVFGKDNVNNVEACKFIVLNGTDKGQYQTILAVLDVYTNYEAEYETTYNVMINMVNDIVSINWDDEFNTIGDKTVTALEELARLGNADYITAQFDSALGQ